MVAHARVTGRGGATCFPCASCFLLKLSDLAAVQPCTADVLGKYLPQLYSPDLDPLSAEHDGVGHALTCLEGGAGGRGRLPQGADAGLTLRRLQEEPASSPASLTAAKSAGKRAAALPSTRWPG